MAGRLAHIFVEDLHGVVTELVAAALQKETVVVGGHIAGKIVVFIPGLHFQAQDVGAELGRPQGGGGSGLAGADDQYVAVLLVGDVGNHRGVAQPGRLVEHEILRLDSHGRNHGGDGRGHGKAFAGNLYVFFRGRRSLLGRILAAVALRHLYGQIVSGRFPGRGGSRCFRDGSRLRSGRGGGRRFRCGCGGRLGGRGGFSRGAGAQYAQRRQAYGAGCGAF